MLDIIKNLLVTYLMHIILDFSCDGAKKTKEGFLRKKIIFAVSYFQNCAIGPYS